VPHLETDLVANKVLNSAVILCYTGWLKTIQIAQNSDKIHQDYYIQQ
jgi:hypothetical protein